MEMDGYMHIGTYARMTFCHHAEMDILPESTAYRWSILALLTLQYLHYFTTYISVLAVQL